jgi:Uma2 family endonuclease
MILFSKGGCKPDSDRMFYEGVPEFVIELWDPNAVTYYDFESTLEFYQRHGVAEVISNDEYRKLKDDKYEIVTPNENGIIVSDVLEGLHWDMASFRDHNWHKMMAAIDHGLSNAGR